MIANCEFFQNSQSINSQGNLAHINTVRGQPLQLLDLQFGLTSLKCNHLTTRLKPVLQ